MTLASKSLRFLIVTGEAIVAEDLKDVLSRVQGAEIDVRSSFDDEWTGVYGLAIIAGKLDRLLTDRRVRDMHRDGTKLVFLNAEIPAHHFQGTGIRPLPQPFSTSDVIDVLNTLGIACPRLV